MAEVARKLGVGTSAIAMAISRRTPDVRNCDNCELRPFSVCRGKGGKLC
jgi:hypothetical protein